jgi:sugar diacid utilization regulator
VAALLVLQQNAVDDADRRVRSELIADLLDGSPQRHRDLDRRARNHDIVVSDLTVVLVISTDPAHRAAVARTAATYFGAAGLVSEHAGTVVAVVSATDPMATGSDLQAHLSSTVAVPVLVVVPPTGSSPAELAARFETAQQTARLLVALGTDSGAVSTEAYTPYRVMFGHDPEALHTFIAHTIGAVVDYDDAHGTDLIATLRAFVRNEGSPTKTARAMSYHTNTILQRLDRLKALLGPQWRTDETFFRISTAVRLEELRSATRRRT